MLVLFLLYKIIKDFTGEKRKGRKKCHSLKVDIVLLMLIILKR